MKKIAAILTTCLILAFRLTLFSNDSEDRNTSASQAIRAEKIYRVRTSADRNRATSDNIRSKTEAIEKISENKPKELKSDKKPPPVIFDDSYSTLTKEEFDKLSQDDQDKIIEEFVDDFWQEELAVPEETFSENKYIPLGIFNRPYLHTITESEFMQLSPEDQEKAMAETIESCRENRTHIKDIIAQVRDSVCSNDYLRAEAYLISGLEIGRELSANKDGMFITRIVGMSCQKDILNEMTKLYAKTGEHSKIQKAQEQLGDIAIEINEMRETARASEE